MLFHCYLDDSKDRLQEIAYVCAGFVGARWAWKNFNQEWNKQLAAEGLDYFKTSEYRMLTGQFQRFKLLPSPHGRNAAILVRNRLLDVLGRTTGLRGVGVAIPVDVITTVMQHKGSDSVFSGQIYDRAFEGCLYKTPSIACLRGDKVAFVHDQGDDFPRLLSLYQAFKEVNPYTAKKIAGFSQKDDKITPALQIADMLANDVMGRTVQFLNTGVPDAKDVALYERSRLFGWTKEFGEIVLGANLERLGLPIPESLHEAMQRLDTPAGQAPTFRLRNARLA